MEKQKSRKRLRAIIRLIVWVLVVQFLLINISAALYAYKFTHLYDNGYSPAPVPGNMLAKTWRLFAGPRFYKLPAIEQPSFKYSTIPLQTKNKKKIEAWYNQLDSGIAKGTVILFHGLTGNKSTVLQQANEFRYWGYNVMLVDTRSHGNSDGNSTTIGFRESEEVKLAYDYAKQMKHEKIYLWGFSMGAVQIIKAVADYGLKPSGVILEMPFGSLQSHIKRRMNSIGFPKQPFGFFITFWIGVEKGFNGFSFNTVKYAKQLNCPALIQYGSRDQLVDKRDVQAIYDAIPSTNKRLVEYMDANHEPFLVKNPVLWRKEVSEFLK
jgi:uncharacterized protein